jgi:IS605 OrfB family transposase
MSVRAVALTLRPSDEQRAALARLRAAWVRACNYLSGVAWETKTFRPFALQKIAYHECRTRTGLRAEQTLRALRTVCDSYKTDRSRLHSFNANAAVILAHSDAHSTRQYKIRATLVEITLLNRRERIPLAIGGNQRKQLAATTKFGEADLLQDTKGRWRLIVSCHYEDPPEQNPTGHLGVDMGIANIAADSDGTLYSGAVRNGLRHRQTILRKRLQAKGTRSAKRLLKIRAQKQSRFQRDSNHCISKTIVAKAAASGRGIAIEQLVGIRQRITARGAEARSTLSNWGFGQLGEFITYKARMHGIRVVQVDPRNTSRTCLTCGSIDKANRPSQAVFRCVSCGESGHADHHAARVIAGRAAAMQPHAAEGYQCAEPPAASLQHPL